MKSFMSRRLLLVLCLLSVLTFSVSTKNKKRRASTIKVVTVFNDNESTGAELGICREFPLSKIKERTREFERDGENWGHLYREVSPGRYAELRTMIIYDVHKKASGDPKAKTNFLKPVRSIIHSNKNAGKPFFSKKTSRTNMIFNGWDSILPSQFIYEDENKLYRGESVAKGILKQTDTETEPLNPSSLIDLKRFLMTRVTKHGHNGLAYLYMYTGEIKMNPENIDTSSGPAKIAIVQNLLQTHFADYYEMVREFPHLEVLKGKAHNLETIRNRHEQNMIGLVYTVPEKFIDREAGLIKFEIPVIIHTTVLPPKEFEDQQEVGVPKSAKIYANFLNSQKISDFQGRYVFDCLFSSSENPFIPVGSLEDSIHRRVIETRNVLNKKYQPMCLSLTLFFAGLGVLLFLHLICGTNKSNSVYKILEEGTEEDSSSEEFQFQSSKEPKKRASPKKPGKEKEKEE